MVSLICHSGPEATTQPQTITTTTVWVCSSVMKEGVLHVNTPYRKIHFVASVLRIFSQKPRDHKDILFLLVWGSSLSSFWSAVLVLTLFHGGHFSSSSRSFSSIINVDLNWVQWGLQNFRCSWFFQDLQDEPTTPGRFTTVSCFFIYLLIII